MKTIKERLLPLSHVVVVKKEALITVITLINKTWSPRHHVIV